MESRELNYECMMYLHGLSSAKNVVMMEEILKGEDTEMACLDLQFKVIAEHCLYLAIAEDRVTADNFEHVVTQYANMCPHTFTLSGRMRDEEDPQIVCTFIEESIRPAKKFLRGHDDEAAPPSYMAFLDAVLERYSDLAALSEGDNDD